MASRATEPDAGIAAPAAAAQRALRENRIWYHTIELAPGIVTPGRIDLRRAAERILPSDLSGRRALDIGTFDGFWAFEMERRGAEVVAIDVERLDAAEWPPVNREAIERRMREWGVELGRGFKLAAEALGSRVSRVICNVYDLTPDAIGGRVDFAFAGAILLHLRDPVGALERVHGTLAEGGELRLMEPWSLGLTLRTPRRPSARFKAATSAFTWWLPNLTALSAWPRAAGFASVERFALLYPPARDERRQFYAGLRCLPGEG
jgi:SAM-dependent methyltransferase